MSLSFGTDLSQIVTHICQKADFSSRTPPDSQQLQKSSSGTTFTGVLEELFWNITFILPQEPFWFSYNYPSIPQMPPQSCNVHLPDVSQDKPREPALSLPQQKKIPQY